MRDQPANRHPCARVEQRQYSDAPGEDARAQHRSRAEARGVREQNLSFGTYVADWHDAFLAETALWVASGEVRYRA